MMGTGENNSTSTLQKNNDEVMLFWTGFCCGVLCLILLQEVYKTVRKSRLIYHIFIFCCKAVLKLRPASYTRSVVESLDSDIVTDTWSDVERLDSDVVTNAWCNAKSLDFHVGYSGITRQVHSLTSIINNYNRNKNEYLFLSRTTDDVQSLTPRINDDNWSASDRLITTRSTKDVHRSLHSIEKNSRTSDHWKHGNVQNLCLSFNDEIGSASEHNLSDSVNFWIGNQPLVTTGSNRYVPVCSFNNDCCLASECLVTARDTGHAPSTAQSIHDDRQSLDESSSDQSDYSFPTASYSSHSSSHTRSLSSRSSIGSDFNGNDFSVSGDSGFPPEP